MYIYHDRDRNHKLGSLLWRMNPFTKLWEFWDWYMCYWSNFSNNGPSVKFKDKIVSYRSTWCEPVRDVEK